MSDKLNETGKGTDKKMEMNNKENTEQKTKRYKGGRNKGDGLNDRQLKFVEHYLATGNGTESYCRAYETDNRDSAAVGASNLLKNEKIIKRIEERKSELRKLNRIASPEEMYMRLTDIMFDPNTKATDQIAAIKLLGSSTGLWVDRQEINQTNDFIIELTGELGKKPKEIIDAKLELIEHDGDED